MLPITCVTLCPTMPGLHSPISSPCSHISPHAFLCPTMPAHLTASPHLSCCPPTPVLPCFSTCPMCPTTPMCLLCPFMHFPCVPHVPLHFRECPHVPCIPPHPPSIPPCMSPAVPNACPTISPCLFPESSLCVPSLLPQTLLSLRRWRLMTIQYNMLANSEVAVCHFGRSGSHSSKHAIQDESKDSAPLVIHIITL